MGWGNASDKHIVRESGLVNLLEAGDSIMADKGFDIDDFLKPLHVTLNMPPKRILTVSCQGRKLNKQGELR